MQISLVCKIGGRVVVVCSQTTVNYIKPTNRVKFEKKCYIKVNQKMQHENHYKRIHMFKFKISSQKKKYKSNNCISRKARHGPQYGC